MQGQTYGLKAQVGIIGGVLTGFVSGIHKDSVRRWNLWFPSAGIFAEVLVGRATGMQITFPPMTCTTTVTCSNGWAQTSMDLAGPVLAIQLINGLSLAEPKIQETGPVHTSTSNNRSLASKKLKLGLQ